MRNSAFWFINFSMLLLTEGDDVNIVGNVTIKSPVTVRVENLLLFLLTNFSLAILQ